MRKMRGNSIFTRPKAGDWNKLVDMVNSWDRKKEGRKQLRQNSAVHVINTGDTVFSAFSLCRLVEVRQPDDTRLSTPVFLLAEPTTAGDQMLAVVQQNILPGDSGMAVVSGITPVIASVMSLDDTHVSPNGYGGAITGKQGPIRLLSAGFQLGNNRICIAVIGLGGEAAHAGPFDVMVETVERIDEHNPEEIRSEQVIAVRNSALGPHANEAGFIVLGLNRIMVNAAILTPCEGMVQLLVTANDENDDVTAQVILGDIPESLPNQRTWWTRIAYVQRLAAGWQVQLLRQPGDIEIQGRWA